MNITEKLLTTALTIVLAMGLTACSVGTPKYRIGVSQCAGGNWREKVNSEMLAAQHLYDQDVKVSIANAEDNAEVQARQIDSLAESGIDLLVVAPSEAAPIAEAIVKVRQRGIPVIFFDRRAQTSDYTAFIGGDNVETGRTIARYIAANAATLVPLATSRKPRVLEITGGMDTSPAQERHQGFSEVMNLHKELDYHFVKGQWTGQSAYETMERERAKDYDIVFCHNDGMADGACQAFKDAGMEHRVKVIGIDGMPGDGQGIDMVERGRLAATCIYPTHGEKIVELALKILSGQPYERENVLDGMMVTPQNVKMVAQSSNELMEQVNHLVTIHDKLEDYYGLYNTQRKLMLAAIAWIVLLIAALALAWRAYIQTRRTLRKRQAMNEEQARFYTNTDDRRLRQVFEVKDEVLPAVKSKDTLFAEQLNEVILKNLSNPNLKMDDLGEAIGLSRVQLYRKVKAATGLSPVELLREMRLQRGYVLLTTTTKTVNEVAYEVGFNTPGYFSKCFKSQFGKYPTELRT